MADALPKLQGLARYSEVHSEIYRKVEAIADMGGKLRVLDPTNVDVRNVVAEAKGAESLYKSISVSDYAYLVTNEFQAYG